MAIVSGQMEFHSENHFVWLCLCLFFQKFQHFRLHMDTLTSLIHLELIFFRVLNMDQFLSSTYGHPVFQVSFVDDAVFSPVYVCSLHTIGFSIFSYCVHCVRVELLSPIRGILLPAHGMSSARCFLLLPQHMPLASLLDLRWLQLCVLMFGSSVLLYWSIYVCLSHYCFYYCSSVVLVTASVLFILLRITSSSWGVLQFHVNFRVGLSISVKNVGVFIGIVLDL